jgi:phytoene/squalene synthetase
MNDMTRDDVGIFNMGEHLLRVSRSFAFCIQQLPEPLRSWIGLSYLMCRVLDTIEDAEFLDRNVQLNLFQQFEDALKDPAVIEGSWYKKFPSGLSEGEALLVKDSHRIISQFHALPARVQPLISQMVSTMAVGMKKYILKKHDGILRIESEEDLRGYCYVVAGVVGEALSQIVGCVDSSFRVTDVVLARARQFGEFLQKVNILKDQKSDEEQGRFLIPDPRFVWSSSFESAKQSLAYLEGLPEQQPEFRRFCAWSLFLGLETLNGLRQFGQNKVARDVVERVFTRVEEGFLSRELGLRGYFEELARQIWPEMRLAT